jgi:hypothetical protein
MQRLVTALAAAFMLMSDLRRDAERVTATELRQLAEELESALRRRLLAAIARDAAERASVA